MASTPSNNYQPWSSQGRANVIASHDAYDGDWIKIRHPCPVSGPPPLIPLRPAADSASQLGAGDQRTRLVSFRIDVPDQSNNLNFPKNSFSGSTPASSVISDSAPTYQELKTTCSQTFQQPVDYSYNQDNPTQCYNPMQPAVIRPIAVHACSYSSMQPSYIPPPIYEHPNVFQPVYTGNEARSRATENPCMAHIRPTTFVGKTVTPASPLAASPPRYPTSPIDLSPSACKYDVNSSPGKTSSRDKRKRATFSNIQLVTLNARYQQKKYLKTSDRKLLATQLDLTEKQVKNWFQNRRMKDKIFKKNMKAEDGAEKKDETLNPLNQEVMAKLEKSDERDQSDESV